MYLHWHRHLDKVCQEVTLAITNRIEESFGLGYEERRLTFSIWKEGPIIRAVILFSNCMSVWWLLLTIIDSLQSFVQTTPSLGASDNMTRPNCILSMITFKPGSCLFLMGMLTSQTTCTKLLCRFSKWRKSKYCWLRNVIMPCENGVRCHTFKLFRCEQQVFLATENQRLD